MAKQVKLPPGALKAFELAYNRIDENKVLTLMRVNGDHTLPNPFQPEEFKGNNLKESWLALAARTWTKNQDLTREGSDNTGLGVLWNVYVGRYVTCTLYYVPVTASADSDE